MGEVAAPSGTEEFANVDRDFAWRDPFKQSCLQLRVGLSLVGVGRALALG
jgi:hypothetical protein